MIQATRQAMRAALWEAGFRVWKGNEDLSGPFGPYVATHPESDTEAWAIEFSTGWSVAMRPLKRDGTRAHVVLNTSTLDGLIFLLTVNMGAPALSIEELCELR